MPATYHQFFRFSRLGAATFLTIGAFLVPLFLAGDTADRPELSTAPGVKTRDLGPGLLSFHINGTYLLDDTHYVLSRRVVPATLLGYNVDQRQLTLNKEVIFNGDRTTGGRAMASVGDDLYIVMGLEDQGATLARLDTTSGEIEEVDRLFPPVRVVWDMDAAPDGVLYLATSRQTNARVYEYNPQTGERRDLGAFEEVHRQDARTIAATDDKIYVGIGYNKIDLWSVDRKTGDRKSILPPELEQAYWLYSLDANEDWIAAGTSGPDSRLAVINRNDYSDYRIVEFGDRTIQEMDLVDNTVYFGHGGGVWRYDILENSMEHVADLPINRGVFYRDGMLHGGAGVERIGWHDLETGETETVNLLDQGADLGAEPAQSLATGGGKVFFGGRALGIRDLATGELEVANAPGEAKNMTFVDGALYMAMYTSGHLVRYDLDDGSIEKVAESPEGQLRPRILHYDEAHRLLLMGTQADERGGGALTVYDLETGESEAFVNPIGDTAVATITSGSGLVFIAAQRADGPVGAWDPKTREWLWQVDPPSGEWAIGLAAVGGELFGLTYRGTLFVLDPDTGEYIYQERALPGGGRLLVHEETIYGATMDTFFRVDPESREPKILVDGLNSRWVPAWPDLVVDEEGVFYVVREANVLKIILRE